jgi:hypothetical protein
MLSSLLDVAGIRWRIQGVVLRVAAAALALVGCGFLLGVAWWVIGCYLAPPWPAVVMGAGFLLLAALLFLIAVLRRPPRPVRSPIASLGEASTFFGLARRYPLASLLVAVAAGIAAEWIAPGRRR